MFGRLYSYKEKGAITVFLAIVFMSMIIFAGVVIDIARIAAAERKVQSALNASARSVLAAYDPELTGSYGIYAVNTSAVPIREDFYRYLRMNLKEYHEGVSFINIKVDEADIQIEGMDSLLSDEAFKRQVQEYMKYRLPITAADSLIEQLKNLKLDGKIEFAKGEKALRDKAKELRTKANAVNSKLASLKRKISSISASKLEDIKKELLDILEISSSIYSEDEGGLLDEYNKSKAEVNTKAEESDCVGNMSEEFSHIIENSKSLLPELHECISEVSRTITETAPLIKKVKELKKELRELEKDAKDHEQDIQNIKERIDRLESRIEDEMERLEARLQALSLDGYILKNESVDLQEKKSQELMNYLSEKKKEIEDTLFRRLEKEWLISADELKGYDKAQNDDFYTMEDGSVFSLSMTEDEAESHNDSVLKAAERLTKAVDSAASDAFEKLCTIEYIMDKYTFLTSKTERGHYFRKGEVEYIISGPDITEEYNPIKNTEYYIVTKVLLQVWALRFTLDSIDNFVRSTVLFPPQRLAFALAEGALDSSLDMYKLLNGEEIPILPKSFTAVKLKYSDHLRLLLLMKSEEEMLAKARQLIQVNMKNMADARTGAIRKDFRLSDYSTLISARVEARVNLLFLPMLKLDRLMPDSFDGRSYRITKQIFMGY